MQEFNKKGLVGITGAGTMGSGIAQVAALAGHPVILNDTNPAILQKAESILSTGINRLAEKGKITNEQAQHAFQQIRYTTDAEEFSACSLIIEAVIENLDVKKKIFSFFDQINKEAILATNTSSLSITSVASACSNPTRVIGIHFFNPAPVMPLVEIIPGIATTNLVTENILKLISSWGKTTVRVKDTPGFIVNRIARPYYGESIRIYEEGWNGLPEGEEGLATIDYALKEKGGFKMGPFELMDLIGNDVNYAVTETVWSQFFFDPRYKPSLTQKRLFESGSYGRKSGRGYYSYTDEGVVAVPLKDEKLSESIFLRVISMLINEAADALYYRIASAEDIELAMKKGVNYPKGLLKWCDEIGADKIYNQLVQLRNTYSEERYRPSVLLQKMAEEKKSFF
jgi:3-hydroxybutyryl-CoA dehydrogenase